MGGTQKGFNKENTLTQSGSVTQEVVDKVQQLGCSHVWERNKRACYCS